MANEGQMMLTFFQVIKDQMPAVGDVHVPTALGNASRQRDGRRRLRRKFNPGDPPLAMLKNDDAEETCAFSITVPILKYNDELSTVYGWASVNSEGGEIVTDHQDDQVVDAEIVKAAHDFITSSRTGGVLHARQDDGSPYRGGDIVESVVMTPDVQKALGIDLGRTGWFIGYRVDDADVRALVKSGALKAFSIGGRARRVPV
jgi:hypothetical protein